MRMRRHDIQLEVGELLSEIHLCLSTHPSKPIFIVLSVVLQPSQLVPMLLRESTRRTHLALEFQSMCLAWGFSGQLSRHPQPTFDRAIA